MQRRPAHPLWKHSEIEKTAFTPTDNITIAAAAVIFFFFSFYVFCSHSNVCTWTLCLDDCITEKNNEEKKTTTTTETETKKWTRKLCKCANTSFLELHVAGSGTITIARTRHCRPRPDIPIQMVPFVVWRNGTKEREREKYKKKMSCCNIGFAFVCVRALACTTAKVVSNFRCCIRFVVYS